MKWITREREKCTFDFIVKKQDIKDQAIHKIAEIVRGADTHRFDLAEQAAGLRAISAGLSVNCNNDLEQLGIGMKLYDALYSWLNMRRKKNIHGILNYK